MLIRFVVISQVYLIVSLSNVSSSYILILQQVILMAAITCVAVRLFFETSCIENDTPEFYRLVTDYIASAFFASGLCTCLQATFGVRFVIMNSFDFRLKSSAVIILYFNNQKHSHSFQTSSRSGNLYGDLLPQFFGTAAYLGRQLQPCWRRF